MKKGKSYTCTEWHWGFSKPFFWKAFSPPSHVSVKKMSLLSVLAEGDEVSSDHPSGWQALSADHWASLLSDYPDNHDWATSKSLMRQLQLFNCTETPQKHKKPQTTTETSDN